VNNLEHRGTFVSKTSLAGQDRHWAKISGSLANRKTVDSV
jgi:hypothetical protein